MNKPVYDHDRIIKLWKSGISTSQIAARIGCTAKTVRRVIKKHGQSPHA